MGITSVRLQEDVKRDLERVAERQRRSKSWVINQAVREYARREASEDERWRETLEALDDVAAGRVLPARDVHTWLRNWGTPNESRPPKARR
jgi:predicted transcriptional regulator